jgi:hypothetical protein
VIRMTSTIPRAQAPNGIVPGHLNGPLQLFQCSDSLWDQSPIAPFMGLCFIIFEPAKGVCHGLFIQLLPEPPDIARMQQEGEVVA